MFKGTKGVWYFEGNKTEYSDGDYFDIHTKEGTFITQIDLSNEDENEMRANAKVIAAAPELLDCVNDALSDLSEHMTAGQRKYFQSIVEKATL